MSRIIQGLDRKATGRETILEMVLFDNSSNNSNFTDNIRIVEILYFLHEYSVDKTIVRVEDGGLNFLHFLFYFILIYFNFNFGLRARVQHDCYKTSVWTDFRVRVSRQKQDSSNYQSTMEEEHMTQKSYDRVQNSLEGSRGVQIRVRVRSDIKGQEFLMVYTWCMHGDGD